MLDGLSFVIKLKLSRKEEQQNTIKKEERRKEEEREKEMKVPVPLVLNKNIYAV